MKDGSALRSALQTVTGPRPTRQAVRTVVDRCHRMASAYLRQRRQSGALREDLLGESMEDLAMDAIAELFERDEEGRFPELRRYFADRTLADADPTALEEDLRRLVLGRVTDWLFEAYRSADRSLSNLIRALKRAIKAHEEAALIRRGTTLWVELQSDSKPGISTTSTSGVDVPRRQMMPLDTLESYLTGAVEGDPTTGELADVALEALQAHSDYESAYPVTRLAQAMRAARVRVQAVTEHSDPVSLPDSPLLRTEEIEEQIERTVRAMREQKRPSYVGSGKVGEETYGAYFRALYDRLEARFVPPGNQTQTHYEALSTYLPDLTRDQYRDRHRSRFEYLDQQAREALATRLREIV